MNAFVHDALRALAQRRADLEPRIAQLEMERAALDALLAGLKRELADAENQTRELLLKYVQETGDLKPHMAVQVRRVKKLMYDKDAVLQAALDMGANHLVRVKHELNAREFERQFAQGLVPWAEVEEVNDIVIAVDTRLGDLLIAADASGEGSQP